jgi:hypothetical protein
MLAVLIVAPPAETPAAAQWAGGGHADGTVVGCGYYETIHLAVYAHEHYIYGTVLSRASRAAWKDVNGNSYTYTNGTDVTLDGTGWKLLQIHDTGLKQIQSAPWNEQIDVIWYKAATVNTKQVSYCA